MKTGHYVEKFGFTLVEVMIVVAIIGLLAALAIPSFSKARSKSYASTCQQNRRIIWEALNIYCMDHDLDMSPANFPNLCASRDTLAPGGSAEYVRDWKIFECPVADTQSQHDYAYDWDNGVLIDIRCSNSDTAVRTRHNLK